MTMLMLIGGLVLLIAGGELLVRGASKLAVSLGISPLVVGLTVVAFGTSSPEFAVSLQAAVSGQVDIAFGNVVGSNIFNVLFILGISALIVPLVVSAQIVRQEVPIMIGASLLLAAFALDGSIARWEGGVLFGLLLAYTAFLVVQSRRESQAIRSEYAGEPHLAAQRHWDDRLPVQLLLIVGGLVLLVFGSRWLVAAAVAIAQSFGVSELVIGLTIVAAGTSLPEVAASITAAVRGQRDIAVGNVIGSSTFNILGVLGLSGLLAPVPLAVPQSLLEFDLLVMLAVAFACLPVFVTGATIARWEGAVFLGYYVAYVAFLVLTAQQHEARATFALAMQAVVLPLTVLTLAVATLRAWRERRRH
ncbi:MAG: calcium/sodium antiporter [Gammaproteobacteria bacterium]